MPRVNLIRDPVKERREATSRIILRGMAQQGISTLGELAEKLGVSYQIVWRRMHGNTPWDVDTMALVVKRLRLTAEDCAVILGVRK